MLCPPFRARAIVAALCLLPVSARGEELAPLWQRAMPAGGSVVAGPTGEVLVLGPDGVLERLVATTGELVGTRDVPRSPHPFELLADVAGAYVVSGSGTVLAIAAEGLAGTLAPLTLCLPADSIGGSTLDDGLLIVPLVDGSIAAIDSPAAAELWRVPLGAAASARAAVTRARVALPTEGADLVLLDRADGRRIATVLLGAVARSAGARAGGRLLAGAAGERLLGIDLDDGGRAWRKDIGRGPAADIYPVDGSADAIIATTASQLVRLSDRGQPRWLASLPGRVRAPLVRFRGSIVAVPYRRAEVLAFDLATGRETLRADLGGAESDYFTSGAVATDDVILVEARRGARRLLIAYGPRAAAAPVPAAGPTGTSLPGGSVTPARPAVDRLASPR